MPKNLLWLRLINQTSLMLKCHLMLTSSSPFQLRHHKPSRKHKNHLLPSRNKRRSQHSHKSRLRLPLQHLPTRISMTSAKLKLWRPHQPPSTFRSYQTTHSCLPPNSYDHRKISGSSDSTTVLSFEHEASRFSLGLKHTSFTVPICPPSF